MIMRNIWMMKKIVLQYGNQNHQNHQIMNKHHLKRKQKELENVRCNLCNTYQDIADSNCPTGGGNICECAMARDDGMIYNVDRAVDHCDTHACHKKVKEFVINALKESAKAQILNDNPLLLLANDEKDGNDNQKLKVTLTIRSIFNEVINKDKKRFYDLILPKAVEIYIDCKKLSISTNASNAKHLADMFTKHLIGLEGEEFKECVPPATAFKYNNHTSYKTILKYISADISQKYVLPQLDKCVGLQHVMDGWKFKRELYCHGWRLLILEDNKITTVHVFAGFHKPNGTGAKGAVGTIRESYIFHGANADEAEQLILSILADRAAINHGCKEGIIAKKKKTIKKTENARIWML
eukprot:214005_1